MSAINHVLLEVYCHKDLRSEESEACPSFCPSHGEMATYQCLLHRCPYVDFTSCENTFCYIGEASDEDYGISLGEEDRIDVWKEIAIRKVKEGYEEYCRYKEIQNPGF